jgi:acid phosphatase type 7
LVGTGGISHYAIGTLKANSEVQNSDTWGVLKLTLSPGGYTWEFVPVAGKTFTDSGSGTCH